MKKVLLLLLMCATASAVNAQSKLTKEMLQEISDAWGVDDNGNITHALIVDAPGISKEDIYNRALAFFIYRYNSGKAVIQTQDKESGLIIGKGLYNEVHVGISLVTTVVDAWHVVRVDSKEGKARIMITLTEYEKKIIVDSQTPPNYSTTRIANEYPINPKGLNKTVMGKAFYKSHQRAIDTIAELKRAILEGNTSKELENNDW